MPDTLLADKLDAGLMAISLRIGGRGINSGHSMDKPQRLSLSNPLNS
ncbi:hypothetical protein [Henriciella barbarensis]|nr:hypothetical protein [Henriciella barbarensis]